MSVASETRIVVRLPSAPSTCMCSPLRAEMRPSISGPSTNPVRSAGTEPVTVIELASAGCGCGCAERLAHAGTASAAQSRGAADLLKRLLIFTLLLYLISWPTRTRLLLPIIAGCVSVVIDPTVCRIDFVYCATFACVAQAPDCSAPPV